VLSASAFVGVSVAVSVLALKLTEDETAAPDGSSSCTVLTFTVVASTAPLKTTTTLVPVETFVAPSAGLTETTVGAGEYSSAPTSAAPPIGRAWPS